jgi:hypothetical protein
MIRLPGTGTLSAPDRRALSLLTDLSRLIPVVDPAADVVTIELTDRPARFDSLQDWRAGTWGIETGAGVVRIARASLGLLGDLIDATRERRSPVRDRFDRVPSSENALVAEGIEREPVVSQGAAALRTAAIRAAGRRLLQCSAPWPDGRRWAVAITHDLDVVEWWPAFTALRLSELVRKGAWGRAARTGAAALRALGRAPVRPGISALLEAERARAVHSTWFILCGTPTWRTFLAGDLTYRPETSRTRRVLADLTQNGHAIGLHGSFATLASSDRFAEQRSRLTGLTARDISGVRQHFLRFDLERTPRAMRTAGFRYDSTAGFADRNGFRLGVCDVLPEWSVEGQGAPLAEVPFAWMDRALSKYRGVEDPAAWVTDALELAAAARAVEGLWVGVWHPNLIAPLGFPDAPAAYDLLLDGLAARGPFVGTLDELVRWRELRSRVRITRVAPDGRVELEEKSIVPLEAPPPVR